MWKYFAFISPHQRYHSCCKPCVFLSVYWLGIQVENEPVLWSFVLVLIVYFFCRMILFCRPYFLINTFEFYYHKYSSDVIPRQKLHFWLLGIIIVRLCKIKPGFFHLFFKAPISNWYLKIFRINTLVIFSLSIFIILNKCFRKCDTRFTWLFQIRYCWSVIHMHVDIWS